MTLQKFNEALGQIKASLHDLTHSKTNTENHLTTLHNALANLQSHFLSEKIVNNIYHMKDEIIDVVQSVLSLLEQKHIQDLFYDFAFPCRNAILGIMRLMKDLPLPVAEHEVFTLQADLG